MHMARALGIRDVRAAHFADNPASGNVLRKLGFRDTGRIERRFSLGRGAAADCLVFEEGAPGEEGAIPMTADSSADLYGDSLPARSEEHTSELQSLMRISYAVFCLKKKTKQTDASCTQSTN